MEIPVLLPRIFNYPLTYSSGSIENLKPGQFVVVPFGKNQELGVVWDEIQKTSKKIKIRKIKKKINKFSISKNLINFINWFSVYNLTSKGMVLKMCLGDKKNIFKIEENIFEKNSNKKKFYTLNSEQKQSLEDLKSFGENFNVSMLQGITGSGKTLVYFERIKEIINKKKQILVLLPEIFLTNQLSFFLCKFIN